jgi:hypothetical protein
LKSLGATPHTRIFDPFLGSGTTTLAAARLGGACTGIDVNPFSVLLARCRIASHAGRVILESYLHEQPAGQSVPIGTHPVLASDDAAYAFAVIHRMCQRKGVAPHELFYSVLADYVGEYDTEAVVLLSLAIGARNSANVRRGSNPIWYLHADKVRCDKRPSLKIAATYWADLILADLASLTTLRRQEHMFLHQDFSSADSQYEPFDICLTSPPYLNRLDYVVAHLPELAVLQMIVPIDLESLRKQMIGTTKIVQKDSAGPLPDWGRTCESTLRAIERHQSYASKRYYYYTYYQYFDRLFKSFSNMKCKMKSAARGIVVLQSSFYKDLYIPTPDIAVEMLRSLDLDANIVRTTTVRQHMGQLSPAQLSYVPRKILQEALVYFT